MNKISILGSTGSIGTQALEVVDVSENLMVEALCAGKNISLIEAQARKYRPSFVSVEDEADAKSLRVALADTDIRVGFGMEGLVEAASLESVDTVLTAIVGMLGIRPTIAAIKSKKTIALANKETLVCAGHIIMPLAVEYGVSILPVDSEHSAIFQSIEGSKGNPIKKIILTASGGPFREYTREQIKNVTKEDALKHPNWNMGAKITIDSATMVNKGLELMEAMHLFGVDSDSIEILIHPESILHSAVEYMDGAIIGQMGIPDMKLPISYALNYPNRIKTDKRQLSLSDVANLSFKKPDLEIFPALRLCMDVARRGGNIPTVLNAANEVAVGKFLSGEISFMDIFDYIRENISGEKFIENPGLDDIFEIEKRFKLL